MIPPLHTHSLLPDITLGITRLQGYFTLDVVLAWRGERILAMLGRNEASTAGLHGAYT